MTALGVTRVGLREYAGYWATTLPVRVLAVSAVVMAWRPWATVGGARDAVLLGCAVAFAAWAAPSLDRRPTLKSALWSYRLLRHRTTVVAGGVVVIAASTGEPAWWEGVCVVALSVAYLVLSETWPWRWGRGAARVWGEAIAACAGAGVVVAASTVPLAEAGTGRAIAAACVAGLVVLLGGAAVRGRWARRGEG